MKYVNKNHLIPFIILLTGIGVAGFIVYESPVECAYPKLKEFQREYSKAYFDSDESDDDKKGGNVFYNSDNPEHLVSAMRTLTESIEYAEANEKTQEAYIAVRAIFDECGVEYDK